MTGLGAERNVCFWAGDQLPLMAQSGGACHALWICSRSLKEAGPVLVCLPARWDWTVVRK